MPETTLDLVAWDLSGREIHGRLTIDAPRLADALPGMLVVELTRVTVVDHDTGDLEQRDRLGIDIRRLVVVLASGPRGDRSLRVPVTVRPTEVRAGRYVVNGLLHTPATRGLAGILEGRPWVALTDAVLERVRGTAFARERFETLLVNRSHVQALHHVASGEHERLWLASREPAGWPMPTPRPWAERVPTPGYC